MVEHGLELFASLPSSAEREALLFTDLHAGNVLRAQRRPWLAIDPKPFFGDVAYDGTQHLYNCPKRMQLDPFGTLRRFADLLEIDSERLRLWMFARVAAQPRTSWQADAWCEVARQIAP